MESPRGDAVALLEWPAPPFALPIKSGFLFQLFLVFQKLESMPGQKADLAAGGYPCAKGEAGWDCS